MHTREENKSTELTACAFELFAERGIENVNMDAIAAAANVTKGSLYWHFKSKKEVILAACRHYYRNWQRRVQTEISAVSDPIERLDAVIRFSVKSCLFDEKNRIFTMEILTLSLHDDDIRGSWSQFYDSVREFYIGLVEAAVQAGQLSTSSPRGTVELMLSAMEGFKLQAAFDSDICTRAGEREICEGLMQIIKTYGADAPNSRIGVGVSG